MYGEASYRKGEGVRLYGCSNRRLQLARNPNQPCNAPWVPAPDLERAIRDELGQCVHDAGHHEALRAGLRLGIQKAQNPKLVTETAIKRLDEQPRVKRLYEFGEYTWEQWIIKRDQIRQEQGQLREQAAAYKEVGRLQWCENQSSSWSGFGIWPMPASEPACCPACSPISKLRRRKLTG